MLMNAEKICTAIKTLRKRKCLTQHQLADKLGVTDKAVSKWERGLGTPDISMLNKLAMVLDIDTDNLLEGNIAYLDNNWIGTLDVNNFDTKIFSTTEVYGKPIVYIFLSYFALVGIRKVYIQCGTMEEKLKQILGYGERYGMSIVYNADVPVDSNKMIINGPVFIYGPNLTKYFQRAMSHFVSKTVLTVPKRGAELEIAKKNQVSDISGDSRKHKVVPISFVKDAAKGIEYEPLGNGMIELEIVDKDDVIDVADFLRFIYKHSGIEPYCLEEIATRRGLIPQSDQYF